MSALLPEYALSTSKVLDGVSYGADTSIIARIQLQYHMR